MSGIDRKEKFVLDSFFRVDSVVYHKISKKEP